MSSFLCSTLAMGGTAVIDLDLTLSYRLVLLSLQSYFLDAAHTAAGTKALYFAVGDLAREKN